MATFWPDAPPLAKRTIYKVCADAYAYAYLSIMIRLRFAASTWSAMVKMRWISRLFCRARNSGYLPSAPHCLRMPSNLAAGVPAPSQRLIHL
jgi:hypothetical protein